eukprot:3530332-Amphidinium_carterae.1
MHGTSFFGSLMFSQLGAFLGLLVTHGILLRPRSKAESKLLSTALLGNHFAMGLGKVPRNVSHSDTGDTFQLRGVCQKGKLIPNVYILGAMKAGTTMMAYLLDESGCHHMSRPWKKDAKEWHFFDEHETSMRHMRNSMKRAYWLRALPKCGKNAGKASVRLGDWTPLNLAMTQHGKYKLRRPLTTVDLPPLLHFFYGVSAAHVRFIVMTREPVSRMHSELWSRRRPSSHSEQTVAQ